jgi:cell division FtsZ-interacting protein ZapD
VKFKVDMKSERLKKLEIEYKDLEQWLQLGLVPKKDVEKHKEEMKAIEAKISEEKERLQFLKESGEAEEYIDIIREPGVKSILTKLGIEEKEQKKLLKNG